MNIKTKLFIGLVAINVFAWSTNARAEAPTDQEIAQVKIQMKGLRADEPWIYHLVCVTAHHIAASDKGLIDRAAHRVLQEAHFYSFKETGGFTHTEAATYFEKSVDLSWEEIAKGTQNLEDMAALANLCSVNQ